MKYIILLLNLILLSHSSITAQWTTDTLLNTPVRDTTGILSPLMATMQNGNTYVVWYESDGLNFNLKMQLLDANGYKLWTPGGIVVSNYTQTTSTSPYDIKVDKDGNAVVAFQDIRVNGNQNVVAYKIDQNGNSLWGNAGISLVDSGSLSGVAPSIAITPDNSIFIAWIADSSNKKWVACQRFSPIGTPIWNNIYRIKDSTNVKRYSRPKLLPSINTDVLLLFVEETGSFPGTSTIYTQRIDANGINIWPAAVKVSTKTTPFFTFPQPVADLSGGLYVAFDSSNPISLSLNDVYVQHVDANGNLWSPTGIEAATTLDSKTVGSSCLVNALNEFWVLLSIDSAGSSGVAVQKLDSTGNLHLGTNGTTVIPAGAVTYIPNTINDALTGIILTTIYGGFGANHIKAVKLDYSGSFVWPNISVPICSVNSNKDDVQTGKFINNNLVIVWSDDRNSSGVFAQNIDSTGSIGILTGISNIPSENDTRFYPNPSKNPQIFFNSKSPFNRLIKITDIEGRELMSYNIPSSETSFTLNNLDNFKEGIYFVTVYSLEEKRTFRWIKN